jgi:hypothetical protein
MVPGMRERIPGIVPEVKGGVKSCEYNHTPNPIFKSIIGKKQRSDPGKTPRQ